MTTGTTDSYIGEQYSVIFLSNKAFYFQCIQLPTSTSRAVQAGH